MPPRTKKQDYPTAREMRDRREHVLTLVRAGCSKQQTIERAVRELGIAPSIAERLHREITTQWARDFEQAAKSARPEAIERVRASLVLLRQGEIVYTKKKGSRRKREAVLVRKRNPLGKLLLRDGKPVYEPLRRFNWPAIRAMEAELAALEGTAEPLEQKQDVDVTVRASLLAVVASLDARSIAAIIEEQRELLERAAPRAIPVQAQAEPPTAPVEMPPPAQRAKA